MAYAATTTVPVSKSRAEIEQLLAKFKCTQYTIGSDSERRAAMVQFKAENRIVRFVIPMPDPNNREFTHQKRGRSTWETKRAPGAVQMAVDQAERQRWRALMLVIKAKLESVESKIATFEEEFLAHIVMPNNSTVAEMILPQIAESYRTGFMPKMLPPGPPDAEA